jgi:hypothetical protein
MARSGNQRSLRGRVVVVSIGETDYCRHGASSDAEFKLALKAILAACDDAGLDPRDIDGFASYSDDRSDASRLATALGTRRLRAVTMRWGGSGGAAARRSPMARRPSWPASPTAWTCSVRWRRANTAGSGRPRASIRFRAREPT